MSNFLPNRFVAFGLSILFPGMGQIYKSEVIKGLILMFSGYFIFAVGMFFSLFDYFWCFAVIGLMVVLLRLYSLTDALRASETKIQHNWHNKWYFCLLLAVMLILLMPFLNAVLYNSYRSFKFKGESNLPTLIDGDHIMVNKKFYADNPLERFDVVVFSQTDDPETKVDESAKTIIKRVIGLPGEQIEIIDSKIFLNGTPIEIDYGIWGEEDKGHYGPYSIPEGNYFILGDNRDLSRDSRHYHNPFIPAKNIQGKAVYVYFNVNNFDRIGTYLE